VFFSLAQNSQSTSKNGTTFAATPEFAEKLDFIAV
jgi:hypothetical protein